VLHAFLGKNAGRVTVEEETKSLMAIERRARIAELVAQQGSVRVSELSELFQVSEVTIRSDLDHLNEQGLVVRGRGGAVASTHSSLFIAFAQRTNMNLAEKRRIGRAAARLVEPRETIIMDAGTTVMEMAKSLNSDIPVTVVTNALNVALRVGMLPKAQVILLGGTLIPETVSTVGLEADCNLNNLIAQKIFLGAQAIDVEAGLAETSIDVARVKRSMVKVARQVILLADSSKWGRVAFAKTVPLSHINTMITDTKLPEEARQTLQSLGVELILV
jgi:DeoR/GlpR family transcriptional regulator of sugar metabolism